MFFYICHSHCAFQASLFTFSFCVFSVVAGKVSTRTVTIDGLTDKDGFVSEPWSQLCQLMQSLAQQLQWKIAAVFHLEGSELLCFFSLLAFIPTLQKSQRMIEKQLYRSGSVITHV